MDRIGTLERELLLNQQRLQRLKRIHSLVKTIDYVDAMKNLLIQNNNIKDLLLDEYRKISIKE